MTAAVEKIAAEVKSLPKAELDEFLAWLAEYELQQPDQWDEEMESRLAAGRTFAGVDESGACGYCRWQDEAAR